MNYSSEPYTSHSYETKSEGFSYHSSNIKEDEEETKEVYLHGLKIDYSRDTLFDQLGLVRLKESYMKEDEVSPQERFAFVSKQFSSNPEHAQRLYDYSSKHWLSYATPILSFGRSTNGLPISCYLNYICDTSMGLVQNYSETSVLSMLGGGVGIGFGIRAADAKSTGILPHLKTYDASSLAYRQGKTRRGSYATYLDISHPDIMVFLDMRKPTGDQNMRALNLHHGVNITDDFMKIIEKSMIDTNHSDDWELKDTKSGKIREIVSAKALWQKIIELRMQTGEPYLHFIDTSNKSLPVWLKNKGLKINHSNLCTEILLPTNEDRTAVCCLSSANIEYYNEWKNDKLFLRDCLEMLDNVLDYFIANAPDSIHRAKLSAKLERSVGLGALGWHAFLQKNNIPWESAQAIGKNKEIFSHIKQGTDKANVELAKERGEAPDAKGYNVRLSHCLAIAPNASSSIIMGNTSPSIEPFRANAYRQDTLSGAFMNKNRYLDAIIKQKCNESKNLDYDNVWSSIISNDGSVQHLKFLTVWEKDVFKTSMEIDQRWIIQHASDRQEYIDQGQSVNLFFLPTVDVKYLHTVHFLAWQKGLKTLYYCRSDKLMKADKLSKQIERHILKDINLKDVAEGNNCLACEG